MPGLFGSAILDVIIGLFFVYFLLAVIVSNINERVAAVLKLRAQYLFWGMANLVKDHDVFNELVNSPLIKGLSTDAADAELTKLFPGAAENIKRGRLFGFAKRLWNGTTKQRQPWGGRTMDFSTKPDYIPSRTFALALFQYVGQVASRAPQDAAITLERVREGAKQLAADAKGEKQELGKALLSLIDTGVNPQSLLLSLDDLKKTVQPLVNSPDAANAISSAGSFDQVRAVVLALPDGAARQSALNVIDRMQTNVDDAIKSVEDWFNGAMDSIAGVYKRDIQVFLLYVGMLVSMLLGADTFRMFDALYTTPALRSAVANSASATVNANGQLAPAQGTTVPVAASGTVTTTVTVTTTGNTTTTTTTVSTPGIREALDELNALNLPLGYGDHPNSNLLNRAELTWDAARDWILWLIKKIAGVAITGAAASLGAPFWFDVLKNLSNVRAAVRPREDSKTT